MLAKDTLTLKLGACVSKSNKCNNEYVINYLVNYAIYVRFMGPYLIGSRLNNYHN